MLSIFENGMWFLKKKIRIRIINVFKDEWIFSLISYFINEEFEIECY